jgi:hypothetical protein
VEDREESISDWGPPEYRCSGVLQEWKGMSPGEVGEPDFGQVGMA